MLGNRERQKWKGYRVGTGGFLLPRHRSSGGTKRHEEVGEGYPVSPERPTRGCGEAAILTQPGPRTQH